jgi:hypothetical protein
MPEVSASLSLVACSPAWWGQGQYTHQTARITRRRSALFLRLLKLFRSVLRISFEVKNSSQHSRLRLKVRKRAFSSICTSTHASSPQTVRSSEIGLLFFSDHMSKYGKRKRSGTSMFLVQATLLIHCSPTRHIFYPSLIH